MDLIIWIIVILIVLIVLVSFVYMWLFNKSLNINKSIDEAVEKSQFKPTTFEIYDRSTKDICDRLIIVKPFDWYLWAINNNLYILNPEAGVACTAGSVSAIQVTKTQFIETCLALNFDSILQHYQHGKKPFILDYTIEGETFTILSAINVLARNYVTFSEANINDPTANANETLGENSLAAKMKSFTILNDDDDHHHHNNDDDSGSTSDGTRAGSRILTAENVVKLISKQQSGDKYEHTELINSYLLHTPYNKQIPIVPMSQA